MTNNKNINITNSLQDYTITQISRSTPSQDVKSLTKSQPCLHCGKSFKSLKLHIRKSHPEVNCQITPCQFDSIRPSNSTHDITDRNCLHSGSNFKENYINTHENGNGRQGKLQEISDSTNQCIELHQNLLNQLPAPTTICEYCGKSYKSIGIHLSKAHPEHHRNKISERYHVDTPQEQIESDTNIIADRNSTAKQNKTQKNVKSKQILDFETLLKQCISSEDIDLFEKVICDIIEFLATAIESLPGPKHPAVRYYYARKKHQTIRGTSYSTTQNPERLAKRKRKNNKQKYQYEVAQFHYFNQRRKVVRSIMNDQQNVRCKMSTQSIFHHFDTLFNDQNSSTPISLALPVSTVEDIEITEEDINMAIATIKVDTSAGPDHVLLRAIKELQTSKMLCLLANAMLKFKKCPDILKLARTILIFKGGDENNISNWRPISIFSIIRRIIEKVLDKRLRSFLEFSSYQRGFLNLPGTHINTSIINGCLSRAKTEKRDCCIVFLDISKAYDSIGHEHIKRCLLRTDMPNNLRDLVIDHLQDNKIQIETGLEKTKVINLQKGVAQGSPLSPSLFNLAIDDILKELADHDIKEVYGFQLQPGIDNVSVLAFADDIVLISKDSTSAQILINMVINALHMIGLHLNSAKCRIINVKNGQLEPGQLQLGATHVEYIKPGEIIKYLGVTFDDEIILNKANLIRSLEKDLNSLTRSNLLNSEQKFKILNQYIWPRIIYPLQSTPLNKIPSSFLNDIDILLRSCLKEIINLPHDCPNAMLYAPRKVRGLGLVRAEWEASLLHFNIARQLLKVNDIHLHSSRDFEKEQRLALSHLNIPYHEETLKKSSRCLRNELRNRSYVAWCELPQRGKGVEVFQQVPKTNSWIDDKKGLSASEWTNAIKMSCNTAAVRTIPGRTTNSTKCRHPGCDNQETLGHVLGYCSKGELLRNTRHHKVRSFIATFLRKAQWEVYEEVHCTSEDGSHRRADIIALKRQEGRGLILDPTVRLEQDATQAIHVHEEKEAIYRPCIPHFSERYNLPVNAWTVKGLLFGSRGAAFGFTTDILQQLGMSTMAIKTCCLMVLKDSLHILNNHLYSQN